MAFDRIRHQLIAKLITRFPSLADRFTAAYEPQRSDDVSWASMTKPLASSRIALVTTAGVHHRDQKPFDMKDPDGDPSYRVIDAGRPSDSLMITHDYYDHSDADRDLNVVFPLERLREFEREGLIGQVAGFHYGFMGHITGRHIPTLITRIAPEAAERLKEAKVDAVLLTPG
jgi:D-proline reductase (dithiol) PrdB